MLGRIWLAILLCGMADLACAGDSAVNPGLFEQPGVYELPDGRLLGVGQGRVYQSLRDGQAQRFALDMAERDAKERLARRLFPEAFQKSKKVAVSLRQAQRVSERQVHQTAYVGLAALPGNISVQPIPDPGVILDASRVEVVPEMLLYLEDPLLQLGGGRIFSRDDGWLALGVGLSPLDEKGSQAERKAWKLARMAADRALAETIFGVNFEVLEREAETVQEKNGLARFREWSGKYTREKVEGELRQAVEAGSWRTNDGYLAVVVAVGAPPLGLIADSSLESGEIPDYPAWEVEPAWEFILLSHPRLLKGGALVYPEAGSFYAVGVGAAKLAGNAAHDRISAPRLAEMDASRNIVRYLTGFSVKGDALAEEEITLILDENGLEASPVLEALRKISRERANGLVRKLSRVGSWRSMDEKLLYQAHVVDLRDVFSLERR